MRSGPSGGRRSTSRGAVKIGVRTVGRISDHAVDDERRLRGERGNFLVTRHAFVFELRFGFRDGGLGIKRVLDGDLVGGISGDAAKFHGRGELRPCSVDLLGFNDYSIDRDSPPSDLLIAAETLECLCIPSRPVIAAGRHACWLLSVWRGV